MGVTLCARRRSTATRSRATGSARTISPTTSIPNGFTRRQHPTARANIIGGVDAGRPEHHLRQPAERRLDFRSGGDRQPRRQQFHRHQRQRHERDRQQRSWRGDQRRVRQHRRHARRRQRHLRQRPERHRHPRRVVCGEPDLREQDRRERPGDRGDRECFRTASASKGRRPRSIGGVGLARNIIGGNGQNGIGIYGSTTGAAGARHADRRQHDRLPLAAQYRRQRTERHPPRARDQHDHRWRRRRTRPT